MIINYNCKKSFGSMALIIGLFSLFIGGCATGGSAVVSGDGDAKGGDATNTVTISPNFDISPEIKLEIKDSLKDLVDLPLGDSAIDAAVQAAGDYLTGGSKSIAKAATKGVEAATNTKPDLTATQQGEIEKALVDGMKKDAAKK